MNGDFVLRIDGVPEACFGYDGIADDMQQVGLQAELENIITVGNQPSVMMVTSQSRVFYPHRLFHGATGHLNITRVGNPRDFRTDPDGVPHVLEDMGADGIVELFVVERPLLTTAKITLNPSLAAESVQVLGLPALQQFAPFVEWQRIDDPVRSRESSHTTTDVNDQRISGQRLFNLSGVLFVHGRKPAF